MILQKMTASLQRLPAPKFFLATEHVISLRCQEAKSSDRSISFVRVAGRMERDFLSSESALESIGIGIVWPELSTFRRVLVLATSGVLRSFSQ